MMDSNSRVAVITESSSCVPREVVEQYGIHILPLHLIFEDGAYLDGVNITPQEFYRLLRNSKKLPTSSSPSPGEYFEAFRELGKKGSSILCITLPAHLGMSYESAMKAKDMAEEEMPHVRLEVFPARCPSLAQGFIAQAAAQSAVRGNDLGRVMQAASDMMYRVNAIAMLDTLYYLAKGGRIPKAAAWAGDLFKIKPILDASDDVRMIGRCRTRKRALQRLLDIMEQRAAGKPLGVTLMHADAPEEAELVKADILSRFDCLEFHVTDFTPVMGTHTGPGAIGISFYTAKNVV